MIAALYVETGGVYYGRPGVDPWDKARDARAYPGPYPVVAHPPCQRWGRFWHGGPSAPHTRKLGDDDGCFEAALRSVRTWGGVIEHPADSLAWSEFGLPKPRRNGGWVGGLCGGWSCCVYQGHYGHPAGKATWLYVSGVPGSALPELIWGPTESRIPEWMIDRYGRKKASRIGVVAMAGGREKTRIRNATPPQFAEVLIGIARSAQP